MISNNNIDDEKPNLRPKKYSDANGKSLGTCYCFRSEWGGSSIYASWNNENHNRRRNFSDRPGLFGIEQPMLSYSLHKQKRWKLFDDFRQNLFYSSDSSSDDELNIQSQSKQRRKKHSIAKLDSQQNEQETYHVKIHHRQSERSRKFSHKPLSFRVIPKTTKSERSSEDDYAIIQDADLQTERIESNIIYTADISSRRKQIRSVRTNHKTKSYRCYSYRAQSKKYNGLQEESDLCNDDDDDDEFQESSSIDSKVNPLQLNNFLPLDDTNQSLSNQSSHSITTDKFDPKSAPKYWGEMVFDHDHYRFSRQKSREKKQHFSQNLTTFMPLSFCSVAFYRTQLTFEKNFIQAECYPTKYLLCLTDRLKSRSWSNKKCYLILILNENSNIDDDICHAQVGLNMDSNGERLEFINYLSTSEQIIYTIEELIEKAIEFLATLPDKIFQSNNSAINQRKRFKDRSDHQLNDSKFFNKQIQQVNLLETNDLQTSLTIQPDEEEKSSDLECIRPTICTNCCQDMNDFTPMTALKTCRHWHCNECWKHYLETSIQRVKLIRCLEWNCSSVVDAGTILSLVNVRCLNIYERHIENCLINLSRSYVRCPLISCSAIIQIVGSASLDYIRCRCGHQFCLDCKQESHFPATCRSYQLYMSIVKRDADFNKETTVIGQHCISCNHFIEKNGGCNHMRCCCGAEFCWICSGYWKDHLVSLGVWKCPKAPVRLRERVIVEDRNQANQIYASSIYHRNQQNSQVQTKLKENARRLIATIPLNKGILIDSTNSKTEYDKRQTLLKHCYQMVEYIDYLHRICEFVAVSAIGYGNQPKEFLNSFRQFELIIYNLERILEDERGYSAIEHLNQWYQQSEKLIERLRRAVRLRQLQQANRIGYLTS